MVFLPNDATFKGKPAAAAKSKGADKDGGFVATAGEKGRVRVWDLATRTAVAEEEQESASLQYLVCVSPR